MDFLTLDIWGVAVAFVLGFLLLLFGLNLGYFFVASMIAFLVLSAIVTYTGMGYKKRMKLGQEPRGIMNVLANGLPPLLMVILFYVSTIKGYGLLSSIAVVGFVASVAGITADKFSSELGVLNGMPRMILTMKKVKKGTSGGISSLGAGGGLVAAFIVSLFVIVPLYSHVFAATRGFNIFEVIMVITAAGFLGSIVDSILGYFEEKGIGNKFTSNFFCGMFAGFVAMLLFVVL
ncbi:MAG: DUF92 domain-containing protein [Candidatus Micrarchaeaceae archaeon]